MHPRVVPRDYDVLENGVVIGRIFMVPVAPEGRPWMWASGHNGDIRRAAHGYEPSARPRWRPSLRVGGGPSSGNWLSGFFSGSHLQPVCSHLKPVFFLE
jgi:hypothetical protein